MAMNQRFWAFYEVLLLLFFLFFMCGLSASLISDTTFDSQPQIGRNLLQAKKECPMNFEVLNYTIITSKCKAPKYPASKCCAAFKEFACPYARVLNDLTNDCASTMFKYINLYGKYPPGLFATKCREGKDGLVCLTTTTPPPPPPTSP